MKIEPDIIDIKDHDEALARVKASWPSIRPWQWAVLWEVIRLRESEVKRDQVPTFSYNSTFGVRANFGHHAGHSTLAIALLSIPRTALVTPTEIHKARLIKTLELINRQADAARIWTSRPIDVIPILETDLTREDVLNRSFPPFSDADICIVDDACLLSQDELRLLRSLDWKKYVELA